MTRALPGKCPLLVPASLRNPQHFHRLCTGLAPLRTSHPHVCAQATGKQSCRRLAGSSRSARAPVLAGPASPPRASVRDTLVPSPAPCWAGRTSAPAGLTSSAGGSQVESQAAPSIALPQNLGTYLVSSCAVRGNLRALYCVGWRPTSISVRCGPTVNRRLLNLNLARLMRQAGKRCYRRRPRRR
jgi:hypothetical protein